MRSYATAVQRTFAITRLEVRFRPNMSVDAFGVRFGIDGTNGAPPNRCSSMRPLDVGAPQSNERLDQGLCCACAAPPAAQRALFCAGCVFPRSCDYACEMHVCRLDGAFVPVRFYFIFLFAASVVSVHRNKLHRTVIEFSTAKSTCLRSAHRCARRRAFSATDRNSSSNSTFV